MLGILILEPDLNWIVYIDTCLYISNELGSGNCLIFWISKSAKSWSMHFVDFNVGPTPQVEGVVKR